MKKSILLTSVFGPFGVDDAFGRKENKMELFHNQITKAQGIASLRFHHRSYGLYFLANNVDADVDVLDFPSRKRFISELKKRKYDAVGISFIAPNFIKAKEMAKIVRQIQPQAEIILGGHGAAIEGVEKLIECDHVAKGEGISWLRRYLGEDESKPIKHPTLPVTEYRQLLGIPIPGMMWPTGALLVPGVGCVNGCRFCATSHFFGKAYTSFFSTGEELYKEICRLSEEMKTLDFQIMDENFLKNKERALELTELVQKGKKPFTFSIFSSSEAIEAFGVENLARLGVTYVWMGAESKKDAYEKNQGRDLGSLIRKMQDHGVALVVSGILFSEHHTPENIQEDVDYLIELRGEFTQFMMLTAMPVTALYESYKKEGKLDFDLPYEDWHGQDKLNFIHPHFDNAQARKILDDAFQQEFDRSSSSLYRLSETLLRGCRTLAQKAKKDDWLQVRLEQMIERAELMRVIFPALKRHSHNALERERMEALERDYEKEFGKPDLSTRLFGFGGLLLSEIYARKTALFGDDKQPPTLFTAYRATVNKRSGAALPPTVAESPSCSDCQRNPKENNKSHRAQK